jgi:hypothetical protein
MDRPHYFWLRERASSYYTLDTYHSAKLTRTEFAGGHVVRTKSANETEVRATAKTIFVRFCFFLTVVPHALGDGFCPRVKKLQRFSQ